MAWPGPACKPSVALSLSDDVMFSVFAKCQYQSRMELWTMHRCVHPEFQRNENFFFFLYICLHNCLLTICAKTQSSGNPPFVMSQPLTFLVKRLMDLVLFPLANAVPEKKKITLEGAAEIIFMRKLQLSI